jgi:hypothetical protein
MIKITDEFIDQLSQMTPEDVSKKYTFDEMVELTTELQRQQAELQKIVDDQQKRIARGKAEVLKRYGRKPVISMQAVDGEIMIGLFVEGDINIYPKKLSPYDSYEIAEFIGKLLRIPAKRQITSEDVIKILLDSKPVPMTDCERRIYFNQVMNWLMNEVEPKPARIKLPWQTLKLCDGCYR